jgi:hypothetical protein
MSESEAAEWLRGDAIVPLYEHLAAFVPLEIREWERQGGPEAWHFEEVGRRWGTMDFRADEAIQFATKGLTPKAIANLVEGLAIMAFVPGGVKFGPLHFEGKSVHEQEATGD